jgi:CRP-like cAMP-binding protein
MAAGAEQNNDSVLAGLVHRLRLHSALADADAEALKRLPHTVQLMRQNSQLARTGELTTQCAILVKGFIHRYRATDLGQRQILAIYVPGDPIDFDHLFLPVADDGLQAVKESLVAYVRHDDLRELLASRPGIAEAVTRALLVDASIFREWTVNVGRRDARARIAHLLCEIALRLKAQGLDFRDSPLPLTQDQIADATGLTPVHVNRTLRSLGAEGAIQRKGPLVLLPDPEALREVGGFDPRYLHLR